MPQQPMVLRVHFYHAAGHQRQSLISAAHHIAYMGSAAKHELLVDDDRTTLESAAIHARYVGERAGSLGYFGTVDAATAQAQIRAAQGPVWRVICSVGEADALAMGGALTTKTGWQAAAETAVPAMIRRLGLDPAHTAWIAAVHRYQRQERNPHIHLLFWESGAPTRRTMQWSAAELHDIRRLWAKALYAPELAQLGQAKDAARRTALTQARHLLDQTRWARRGASVEQGLVAELQQRLAVLGAQLPGRGRLAWAYMPEPVKTATLEVARWLLAQDDRLRAAAQQYAEAAVAFGTVHWAAPDSTDWGGPEQAAKREAALAAVRERALDDLARRLAGPILRAAAQTRPPETDGTAGAAEAPRPDAGSLTASPPPAAVPMGPVSSLLHDL
ncbi:MAG: hypothetical protein OWV35_03745, partial [Firmicutes bacterium]|nr:hypothetical protein [Bacillota bacterium]